MNKIKELIDQWIDTPLFTRKETEKANLFNLEDMPKFKEDRYLQITNCAEEIQVLITEISECFLIHKKIKPTSRRWRCYLKYLDEMVSESLLFTIGTSIGYLLDQTDINKEITPLFEVRLELFHPDIIFRPPLDDRKMNSFYDICKGIFDDIYHMAKLIPRIAQEPDDEKTYFDIANEHAELNSLKKPFFERIFKAVEQAIEVQIKFSSYSNHWQEDRKEFMFYFLKFSRKLDENEIAKFEEDETLIKKEPPGLSLFKEKILYYENVYKEAWNIEKIVIYEKWLKVDQQPFRSSLLHEVKRWSWIFKRHLLDEVINNLQDMANFIDVVERELIQEVKEGDYDNLIRVMRVLLSVREKQPQYDGIFEPLTDVIKLLKEFNVEIPEQSLQYMEKLGDKWNHAKRLAVTCKQSVSSMLGQEVGKLTEKINNYTVNSTDFRKKYLDNDIFQYSCKHPYEQLCVCQNVIVKLEAEFVELKDQAELFEIDVPDHTPIESCRIENQLLKMLWDYIYMVQTSIEEWKKTKWKNLNVEDMDMDSKNFLKEIRGLDKQMRTWDSYIGLETLIKNMITSLRAIGALQNTAIRERHWDQLVVATKVKFTMDETTTLADLLLLNLHNFEDDVQNIVDKACKEMAMEKIIKDLEINWKGLEFYFEEHLTGVKLLRASEDLVETLEENNVQIQNMMMSKYIAFFLTEISGWQKKLGTVDTVLSRWLEVQRTWSYLQPIFTGSEDIRVQLEEDSKRFDEIDIEFRMHLDHFNANPNVIQSANIETLPGQLEALQGKLTMCEKSLLEYLETKRLIFPRFYFVSSADLLDILSNGRDPQKVGKHLTKLFDSIAKLDMVKNEDGSQTKVAHTMISKDGESVQFLENCLCDGQVEVWLNGLMSNMRATVKNEFAKSMDTYPTTPREKWLELYPAQVALAGTQIFWTTEVNAAFTSLEEGYEPAMKNYYKKQIAQLNVLITMLLGNLTKQQRQKVKKLSQGNKWL